MSIVMRGPEGAQAQVPAPEAENLKKLGWRERSYDEYKKPVAKPIEQPIANVEESATIVPVVIEAPQDTPPRRPGRPPKIASEI